MNRQMSTQRVCKVKQSIASNFIYQTIGHDRTFLMRRAEKTEIKNLVCCILKVFLRRLFSADRMRETQKRTGPYTERFREE